ncbi:DUF3100 domain-containing protein [Streptomyces asiaticus]
MAMGAGVGSGSMMAASSASIVAAHPADQEAILGTAAVSNLITTVLGVYIGIYIALPLADRVYRLLTRGQDDGAAMVATTGPGTGAGASATTAPARSQADDVAVNRAFREQVGAPSAEVKLPLWLSLGVLTVLGIGAASVSAKALSCRSSAATRSSWPSCRSVSSWPRQPGRSHPSCGSLPWARTSRVRGSSAQKRSTRW